MIKEGTSAKIKHLKIIFFIVSLPGVIMVGGKFQEGDYCY